MCDVYFSELFIIWNLLPCGLDIQDNQLIMFEHFTVIVFAELISKFTRQLLPSFKVVLAIQKSSKVQHLNSGHLWFSAKVSAIERCPLYRG